MKTEILKRVFLKDKTELADPSRDMKVNEVLDFYSGTYPELTTASVVGPEIKDDKVIYKFQSNVGTKG